MSYVNEADVYARPESRDQFKSSHRRCSIKKGFLQKIANSLQSTCVGVSF